MNKMTKILLSISLVIGLCLVVPAPVDAQQVTLSSTTTASAITSASATTINLTSTSTMLSQGPANQINTALYIDKEFMWVSSVIDSTHVLVQRGKGGTRPYAHVSGATVYFGNTQLGNTPPNILATSLFRNEQLSAETWGACTAASELVVPKIYVVSGNIYDCLNGQWVITNSMNHPVYGGTVASVAGVQTTLGTSMTISGTNAITGFTVPNGFAPGMCITIFPTGAFTTTTATNISLASTAVAHKTLLECWDGAKFNPSY